MVVQPIQQHQQLMIKRQRRHIQHHFLNMMGKVSPTLPVKPAFVAKGLVVAVHALFPKCRVVGAKGVFIGKADACCGRQSGTGANKHIVAIIQCMK